MSLAVSSTPRTSSLSPGDVTSAPVMFALSDCSYHHTSSVDIYTPRTRSIAVSNGEWWPGADWWLVHYCGHMPPLSIVSTLYSLSIVSTLSILAASYQAELHGDTETTSTRPPGPAPRNARRRIAETSRKLQQDKCLSVISLNKGDMFIKGNVPKASLYRLPKPRMLLYFALSHCIALHILCFVRMKQCVNAS